MFRKAKKEIEAKLPEWGFGGQDVIETEIYYIENDEEIKACVKMLMDTDAGTGFMHESFYKDDAAKFTREWFAWQNTLFGELILKLVNEGKTDLLNSIQ